MGHDITKRTKRIGTGAKPFSSAYVFGQRPVGNSDLTGYVAIKRAGVFHPAIAKTGGTPHEDREYEDEFYLELDYPGIIYGPIHPSMTMEDIEGATYAHDDGTHWLFAHCSPGEQLDFAAEAEAYAVAQFADTIQASNSVGALADTNGARNTAYLKTSALLAFARAVGQRVHKVVVGETLGHWHRNPHHDHKRELTVAAVQVELRTLKQNQEADADSRAMLGRVEIAATRVISRLTSTHTIEWRHARQERLQREALKKAIRGIDPVQSHEYIFTAAATGDSITGAENLPDPAWAMDKAELVNGITRGTQVWYDGYPKNLSPERPFAIAYRRVPTAGSEWVFVQSFRIYV